MHEFPVWSSEDDLCNISCSASNKIRDTFLSFGSNNQEHATQKVSTNAAQWWKKYLKDKPNIRSYRSFRSMWFFILVHSQPLLFCSFVLVMNENCKVQHTYLVFVVVCVAWMGGKLILYTTFMHLYLRYICIEKYLKDCTSICSVMNGLR